MLLSIILPPSNKIYVHFINKFILYCKIIKHILVSTNKCRAKRGEGANEESSSVLSLHKHTVNSLMGSYTPNFGTGIRL